MKTKILMVCLGNICRSPLAQGILQTKLDPNLFMVDSAGTSQYHIGQQPDKRSILIAKENKIDITNQKGRQFVVADFDIFDKIYAMDNSNYKNILKLSRNTKDTNKVSLILNEIMPEENCDIPDPYTGGIDGFRQVFEMLDQACNVIASKLYKP